MDNPKTKVNKMFACCTAMSLSFMNFFAHTNRACGVESMSKNETLIDIYLSEAEKNLQEIEQAIYNYRNNLPQSYEKSEEAK